LLVGIREIAGVNGQSIVSVRRAEFYVSLAAIHPKGKAKNILLKMAEEELKHKEKMEYHYTNAAFPQTDGG